MRTLNGGVILRGEQAEHELLRQRHEAAFLDRFADDLCHQRKMGFLPIAGGGQRGYTSKTEGAVALVAATAKTVIAARAGSTFGIQVKQWELSFDGVTASAVPALWELCNITFATNAPGTNSTSTTVNQAYGNRLSNGCTAGKNWTTEPTTITVLEEGLLTPNGGLIVVQYPLGNEQEGFALNDGLGLRITAPAIVNVRASLRFEPY